MEASIFAAWLFQSSVLFSATLAANAFKASARSFGSASTRAISALFAKMVRRKLSWMPPISGFR